MLAHCLLLLSLFSQAYAETLRIPVGQQGSNLDVPHYGQSQTLVIQRFGLPLKQHAPVGEPPITRWDYAGFSVYFEYQHVVNSVRQHERRE